MIISAGVISGMRENGSLINANVIYFDDGDGH